MVSEVYIGTIIPNEKAHNRIITATKDFVNIANRYTIDCELSRQAGTSIYAPKFDSDNEMRSHLAMEGNNALYNELEPKWISYWMRFTKNNGDALSTHEIDLMRPEFKALFEELAGEYLNS